MKILSSILFFILFITSCNNISNTKYINIENQKEYSEKSFNIIKENIEYKIIEEKNTNDSLIIKFKLNDSTILEKLNLLSLIDKKFNLTNLENLKGIRKNKPTVINFWFTTCYPCIIEMPYLEKMKKKYSDDVNFIGITFNSEEEIENFTQKNSFNFKHITLDQNKISSFGISAYPKTFFIDNNGIIKNYTNGISIVKDENGKIIIDKNDNEIEDEIKKLL